MSVNIPNSEALFLRLPALDEEDEFLRAHRATSPEVPNFLHHYEEGMPLARYLEVLARHERGEGLPPNLVPSTFLFAFVDDRIVGRVAIRHSLNAFLERTGGHLGYVVVPEFRRRGYATTILRLALQIARHEIGLERVLITCDVDNVASHGVQHGGPRAARNDAVRVGSRVPLMEHGSRRNADLKVGESSR